MILVKFPSFYWFLLVDLWMDKWFQYWLLMFLSKNRDELSLFLSGCLVNGDLVDCALFLGFLPYLYSWYFFSGHATQAWLGLVTRLLFALLLLAQQLMSCELLW